MDQGCCLLGMKAVAKERAAVVAPGALANEMSPMKTGKRPVICARV